MQYQRDSRDTGYAAEGPPKALLDEVESLKIEKAESPLAEIRHIIDCMADRVSNQSSNIESKADYLVGPVPETNGKNNTDALAECGAIGEIKSALSRLDYTLATLEHQTGRLPF